MTKIITLFCGIFMMFGCNSAIKEPLKESNNKIIKTLFVNSQLTGCNDGISIGRECLKIRFSNNDNWQPLYGNIEGFNYKSGFQYKLLVLEEVISNPPADAPNLKYTLKRQISKTKV